MTIGDGILWSTVLLLLAAGIYHISMRRQWKAVRRVVVLGLLVVAAVSGVAWGWSYLRNRPSRVTELGGIRLGMTPVEVKLLKGPPSGDTTAKAEEDSAHFRMDWYFPAGESSEKRTSVHFFGPSSDSLEAGIICSNGDYETLLGLSEYSAEQDIIARLGKPSTVSINSEGLAKVMSYSSLNVAYELTKGRVSDLCITSTGAVTYVTEYGAGAGRTSRVPVDSSRDAEVPERGSPTATRMSGTSVAFDVPVPTSVGSRTATLRLSCMGANLAVQLTVGGALLGALPQGQALVVLRTSGGLSDTVQWNVDETQSVLHSPEPNVLAQQLTSTRSFTLNLDEYSREGTMLSPELRLPFASMQGTMAIEKLPCYVG